jgi:hypothetical protein
MTCCVNADQGSQSISIQILVIYGDMLGWRIDDSICWSNCEKGPGRMEARMGSKTSDGCVFGRSSDSVCTAKLKKNMMLEIRLHASFAF